MFKGASDIRGSMSNTEDEIDRRRGKMLIFICGVYALNALVFLILNYSNRELLCSLDAFKLSNSLFIDWWPAARRQLASMREAGDLGIRCMYDVYAYVVLMITAISTVILTVGSALIKGPSLHRSTNDIQIRKTITIQVIILSIIVIGFIVIIDGYEKYNIFALNSFFDGGWIIARQAIFGLSISMVVSILSYIIICEFLLFVDDLIKYIRCKYGGRKQ